MHKPFSGALLVHALVLAVERLSLLLQVTLVVHVDVDDEAIWLTAELHVDDVEVMPKKECVSVSVL